MLEVLEVNGIIHLLKIMSIFVAWNGLLERSLSSGEDVPLQIDLAHNPSLRAHKLCRKLSALGCCAVQRRVLCKYSDKVKH